MINIFKFALENNEVTISKEEFMVIACQEATEELTKVYKKPNKKYKKAMAQFSFILARIVFKIFDEPQIQKARAEQTAPEEPTTEPTEEAPEEVQEEPTAAPKELSKGKRYFKVANCVNEELPINGEKGDIGELVVINQYGHYALANIKWCGHNADNHDNLEEQYRNHCWWFLPEKLEEVTTDEQGEKNE